MSGISCCCFRPVSFLSSLSFFSSYVGVASAAPLLVIVMICVFDGDAAVAYEQRRRTCLRQQQLFQTLIFVFFSTVAVIAV